VADAGAHALDHPAQKKPRRRGLEPAFPICAHNVPI
jgi:hypothetical protein